MPRPLIDLPGEIEKSPTRDQATVLVLHGIARRFGARIEAALEAGAQGEHLKPLMNEVDYLSATANDLAASIRAKP